MRSLGFAPEGAIVRDVNLTPLAVYSACTFVILMAEAFAIHEPLVQDCPRRLRRDVPRQGFLGWPDPRSGLRSGSASPPRALPGDEGGDGGPRSSSQFISSRRGATKRRCSQMVLL